MHRALRLIVPGVLFALWPAAAIAQNGCVHSPECPTALLGLVGTAGAALYVRLRAR